MTLHTLSESKQSTYFLHFIFMMPNLKILTLMEFQTVVARNDFNNKLDLLMFVYQTRPGSFHFQKCIFENFADLLLFIASNQSLDFFAKIIAELVCNQAPWICISHESATKSIANKKRNKLQKARLITNSFSEDFS